MNNITFKILIILVITILNISAFATSYTWKGYSSNAWNTASNWNPSGVPDSTDNVTIDSIANSTTNSPLLSVNTKVNNLTITSGTLNLGGNQLLIKGTSNFNGGKIYNGLIKPVGQLGHFGGTHFNAAVNAKCGYFHMNGGQFDLPVTLEDTGYASTSGTGASLFNDSLTIIHRGTLYFTMASTTGDVFNGPVTLTNYSTHEIAIASSDSSTFNGNIIVNSTSSGGILFGNTGGKSVLTSGKTISVGTVGFTNDFLTLRKFTQLGSTAQTITLTSSGAVNIIDGVFGANLTISASGFLLKNSSFYGTSSFTKNGTPNYQSDGGNIFYGATTINNSGSAGRIRMATITADNYFGNASFNSTGQDLQIAYVGDNHFEGDITINSNKVVFNTSTGRVYFSGTNAQTLNGSYNYAFKKVTLNKNNNHLTANSTMSIDDSLTFIKGTLITTSTNLLTMKAGSKAIGASNNSFVSGPLKKIGNTTFVFPTGKGLNFRAIEITAPTSSTDAFTAEFVNAPQTLGTSIDTSISFVNSCDYWTLNRISGSSNVKVTLHWNAMTCNITYLANLRVANWDGVKWKSIGNENYIGSLQSGSVRSSSFASNFTAFAFSNISVLYSGAPNLNAIKDFALLAKDSIYSEYPSFSNGKVGAIHNIYNFQANDSILPNDTGSVTTALDTLLNVIYYINGLPSSLLNNNLNGDSISADVYRINGNCLLSQHLDLHGDSTSIFIFNISGELNVDSGAKVVLNGVRPYNIYWIVNNNSNFNSYIDFPGIVISKNQININGVNTKFLSLYSLKDIKINSDTNDIGNSLYFSPSNLILYVQALNQACNYSFNGCNEVYNSNFDYNTSIPTSPSQLNLACPWYNPNFGSPSGTPDYYHVNASTISGMNLPFNTNSGMCQNDNSGTGKAFAGLYNELTSREYIQQQLNSPLGTKKYYGEFYVNLKDKCFQATDRLGMLLSVNPVNQTGYAPIIGNAQIESPAGVQLSDHDNWVRISGCFTGNGEKYLTIGNFNSIANAIAHTPNAACSTLVTAVGGGYYLIDDPAIVPFEVKAGPPVTVACQGTVQLGEATCVSNLNTGQFTYNWTQISGPLISTFNDPTIFNPTLTFANNTGSTVVLVFQVTLTSPGGCVETDMVNVTVGSCAVQACDLDVAYCLEDYTVSGIEVWDATTHPACPGNIISIENTLRIPAGTELTISGMQVRFGPNGKIVVERGTPGSIYGGRLRVINFSKLLPVVDCMWEGVQVWGYKNYSIYDVAQGVAWFDNSEISYAHCAIYLGRRNDHLSPNIGGFTGGSVEEVDHCLFIDNNVSICYPLGYPLTFGSTFNIHDNYFNANAPLRDPYYSGARSTYFIDINRRRPVFYYDPTSLLDKYIIDNHFENNSNDINSTTAIRCNASVGITMITNEFLGVDRGIFFLSSSGIGQKNIVTNLNVFKGCNIGIYNLSNKANIIYGADIQNGFPGAFGISEGILNQNSIGTTIQSNHIENCFGGILVVRSGHQSLFPLKVWQNNIGSCNISLLAGGNNYNSSWYCNNLTNYGSGWNLYDVPPAGNNYSANIAEQGMCNNFPPSNQFNSITSSTILDIDNQTNSSNNFTYDISTFAPTNYIPSPVNGPVTVQTCAMGISETAYCSQLSSPFRFATEILTQRDTTTDSTMINILNSEIYDYYIRKWEIDSAIAFIDTIKLPEINETLLDLYFMQEKMDSVYSIINRLPSITDAEINYKQYVNILYELMIDSLNLNEMDSVQLKTISEIALGESEEAYFCKGILNEIFSKPITYTCEIVNECGSHRIRNIDPYIKKIPSIVNAPNPCVNSTRFKIPEDITSDVGLELHIYNQMGQFVDKIKILQLTDYEYYCNQLNNGLYLYYFVAPGYKSATGKLIVIRN